jgi:hypothetical protein
MTARREVRCAAHRREPRERQRPAGAEAFQGTLLDRWETRRVEDVIGANAVCVLLRDRDNVVAGHHDLFSAEMLANPDLDPLRIHAQYRRCTARAGALNDVEPDAPQAEDDDRFARPNARGKHRGADAG